MAYDGQIVNGFFKKFQEGAPLHSLPISSEINKATKILETIAGLNGIRFLKPGSDGDGWKVTLDYSDGGIPAPVPKAWDISIATSTVTTTNCIANVAGVTKEFDDLVLVLPAETAVYIGVKININDLSQTPDLVAGTTIANTVAVTTPADTEIYLYYLLYHATKTDSVWAIDIDYRTQLQPSVYG